MLSYAERQRAATEFAEKWANRSYEKGDTHSFWLELLRNVLGMTDVTTKCRFEQPTSAGGFIDVVIAEAKTIVEQKSGSVDLDKREIRQGVMVTPFEQAKRYADSLPNVQRPDFIIVSNFHTFRIHDLNKENPRDDFVEFTLAELPDQFYLLNFLTDPAFSRSTREEAVSIEAGEQIGRLHAALLTQYIDPDCEESQHSLNVLCVRLVFCLFAEDSGLFSRRDAFLHYVREFSAQQMRGALLDLFEVLDTPVAERDPYLSDSLRAFPFVNGGLFKGRVEIPNFTDEIRSLLFEVSEQTNWAEISPTIFGGVFESTLNPETRRSGGMHYTSPENIHRVIDPLFLDDLREELNDILTAEGLTDRRRRNRLLKYQEKLGSLVFFDPACGSGNFLTETYIHLRRLENSVLSQLEAGQTSFEMEEMGASQIKVTLNQFYGIEINDFAVNVARTALWIAELQANIESQSIILRDIDDLPLSDAATIVTGNALRMDWNEVVPAAECDYIMGNPPFIGYSNHTREQKEDRAELFGRSGGVLDYVACWYKKAADYTEGLQTPCAFVSTNSICQGQQVTPLWKPLFERGISIDFAHRSFEWGNEASDHAQVHVVIIGFSYGTRKPRLLFDYHRNELVSVTKVKEINGYLADAPSVFIERRRKPLSAEIPMVAGGKPTEGGFLLLDREERNRLIAAEPVAEKWIRPFSMGQEFINGVDRYCLWLVDASPADLQAMPLVLERVRAVAEYRRKSTKVATRRKAETPWLFDEIRPAATGTYIGVPAVSSERRKYIPMGFVCNGMIPGNKLYFIPTGSLYVFGIMVSQFHNAWMRTVTGRLEMRYNYANTIVYNNFIWPNATEEQKLTIELCAQAVLDARDQYEGATLADLYDPDNNFLYPALVNAHDALDRAVEEAYGVDFHGDEKQIVAHLFELYAQVTSP